MSDLPVVAPGYEPEPEVPEAEDLSGAICSVTVLNGAVLTEAMRAAMDRPFFRVLRAVELVVLAAALGLLIWAVCAKQSAYTVAQAVFLFAAAAFFYYQQFVRYPKRAVKNQLLRQASDDGAAELENRLWFTEEHVANRRGADGQLLHMDYGKIKRITRTDRLLILTTRSNRLIPLDRSRLEPGAEEALLALLARKTGLRP